MTREQAEDLARSHQMRFLIGSKEAGKLLGYWWVADAILEAVAIEREACARMFDTEPHREIFSRDVAESIRARSA